MTNQNQKPENSPAFPVIIRDMSKTQVTDFGMSLWDFFAAHALSGTAGQALNDTVVNWAANIADLMLAERAKRGIK